MSVPVNKRTKSQFEAINQFMKLRRDLTELMLNDFGFSIEKQEKKIEKFRQIHQSASNVEEQVERWRRKNESFNAWFIDKECDALLDILRKIETEFVAGNSIYPSNTPSKFMEYCERRKHINNAIAECYVLKSELNYIINVFPSDINKMSGFVKRIDEQIAMFKGVRKSDNKFLKGNF